MDNIKLQELADVIFPDLTENDTVESLEELFPRKIYRRAQR